MNTQDSPGRARALLPLTVWLCPDDAAARPSPACQCYPGRLTAIGAQLSRHLITACTQPGDLVMEMYARTETILESALQLDRVAVALTQDVEQAKTIWATLRSAYTYDQLAGVRILLHSPGQAHLAVTGHAGKATLVVAMVFPTHDPCPACPTPQEDGQDLAEILYGAWRALADGSHFAVVTSARCGTSPASGALRDPTAQIIRQARLSGYSYTQHVVALRAPIRAGELVVQVEAPSLAQLRDARSIAPPKAVSVHADILIFTKRTGRSEQQGGR